jgi:hypothetical protein
VCRSNLAALPALLTTVLLKAKHQAKVKATCIVSMDTLLSKYHRKDETFFFFFGCTGFELKASSLLGKCSTTKP